ncbi:hypothetical protein AB0M02_43755 [Actinoplanes sp. NPDC051861]|uniref:hypothetical protein n=1 Tax=Actinoplanes sp. NPDC051861 TaxID=3155170 RepID=UPI003431AFDE
MSQILLVWSALLTVLTALNLMLCLAIVRRLKTQSQHEHDQLPDLLAPGNSVGEFEISTLDGDLITAGTLDGRLLVAFVMPGCEPCADAVAQLRERGPGEKTLFVVMGHDEDGETLAYAGGLRDLGEVAVAPSGSPVMHAFGGVTGYPSLFLLENRTVLVSDRRVSALGAAPQPAPA